MKSNNFRYITFSLLIISIPAFMGCEGKSPGPEPLPEKFILKAADLSFLPEIEDAGVLFYNRGDQAEDMLTTLKNAGMNTVRIRLWNNPANGHSGLAEVRAFSERVKAKGMKVWLTVHYSDTWADPGNQQVPEAWKNLGFYILKDSLYNYTAKVVREIKPDYYQVGNEINNGMMWPQGNITYLPNFRSLLEAGVKAVRDNSNTCKIMIHYAGIDNADAFFTNLTALDYDIIGLSYYPLWHGKSLSQLETTLGELGPKFNKQVLIAETSYPFTLGWNDWTNNVIGLENQILEAYPATPAGQKDFLNEIKRISTATDKSIGFAYWGGEWVAYKGAQATNGSSWENQAFYDFDNRALPAIEAFN